MSRVLVREGDQPTLQLRALDDLNVPSLQALSKLQVQEGHSTRFMAGGEEWLAKVMPLESRRWEGLRILMAIPTRELLADVNATLQRQLRWSLVLIALTLPLGWLAGRRVGRSLSMLTAQAYALTRFDFRRSAHRTSPVREVRALAQVMDRMSYTIKKFLQITHHISAESRMDVMLSGVLHELVRATSCTGGAVYLVQPKGQGLQRAACHCENPAHESFFPQHLDMTDFSNPGAVRHGDGAADESLGRVLRVPLHASDGQPLGLLMLRYVSHPRQDDEHSKTFAEKLSGTLSVAIETRRLVEGQKKLFDAVIRVLADAIDAKSSHTGGHCERVP